MTRHVERRERYQALREAGFTPNEARQLRDSGIRSEAALRATRQGRPVEEARFQAQRSRSDLEAERRQIEAQRAFRQYRNRAPATDERQRELWGKNFSKNRVPESWKAIHRDYFNRLRQQGVPRGEAESRAWGLTFTTVMKQDFTPETITQADIESYLMASRR